MTNYQGSRFTPFGGQRFQQVGSISITNQIVLNNVGNPQIGSGNFNGGGSAGASSFTSIFGGILGGR